MTNRRQFLALFDGKQVSSRLFFPDISDWYQARRLPNSTARPFIPGELIPDDAEIHSLRNGMPDEWQRWTYLDFYRNFNWGLPAHIYRWYKLIPNGYTISRTDSAQGFSTTWHTPLGELTQKFRMAMDGSFACVRHPVASLEDLDVMEYVMTHTEYRIDHEHIRATLEQIGELGVADLVMPRSPFARLAHDLMGLEETTYALLDDAPRVEAFLAVQEELFLRMAEEAAQADARIVLLSDHADEHIINPRWYMQYCLPYYRKAADILTPRGKILSTHMDGNHHAQFTLFKDTPFNYFDGCTPSPMNNYRPEELRAALGPGQFAYCGVPSTLFTQGLPDEAIIEAAREIIDGLGERVILNVGDILPPNGDLRQVIMLGEWIAGI